MPPQPPQSSAASSSGAVAPLAAADPEVEPYDAADVADEQPDSDAEPEDMGEDDGGDGDGEGGQAPPPKKMGPAGSPEEEEAGKGFMAMKPWVGAIVEPSSAPAVNTAPPQEQLQLQWAHGYRCTDSRSNVAINTRGAIVYPVAALCVVYNRVKHTQAYFRGHTDDVRCLAQNPADRDWMVSGQNATIVNGRSTSPHVCVWNSANVRESYTLPLPVGARAVRTVAFSTDGRFVAAAANDDSHTVYVWDWRAKKMLCSRKGDRNPILQLKFNHVQPSKNAYEFVTVGTKHCFFWQFDSQSNSLKPRRIQLGGAFPTQTYYSATFSEKGHCCLGAFDGSVLICRAGTGAASKTLQAYEGAPKRKPKVFSLDTYQGGIVAGLTDGSVVQFDEKMQVVKRLQFPHKVCAVHVRGKDLLVGTKGATIWEVKNGLDASVAGGEVAGRFEPLTNGHADGELWGLAMLKDGRRALTAGEDNALLLWDLDARRLLSRGVINPDGKAKGPLVRKAATTSLHPPQQCARAVSVRPDQTHAAVGTNDGWLAVFSLPDLQVLHRVDLNKYGQRQVRDQKGNWIQTIEYSPDGRTLAVGTHGSVIVLLDPAAGYAVRGAIKSHRSFIAHLDWSADSTLLRSTCGAYELLFHDCADPSNPRHLTSATALRDTDWFTTHCPFTWGSVGVFEAEDGSSVNSVDRSPDGTLLVSADDLGDVSLYRYPVPVKGQGRRVAKGHSSHVTSARFSPDGSRVLTTGGHDNALFQWAVTGADSSSAQSAAAAGGDDFTL